MTVDGKVLMSILHFYMPSVFDADFISIHGEKKKKLTQTLEYLGVIQLELILTYDSELQHDKCI